MGAPAGNTLPLTRTSTIPALPLVALEYTMIFFSNCPTRIDVSYFTVNVPVPPGGIGCLFQLSPILVHPHWPLIAVITNGSLPVFVNIKTRTAALP